jgi:type II secretory pathway pseudopilin PulG
MPVNARKSEQGFTMITTLLGTAVIAMLVLVAVTTVNGDVHQVRNDLSHKQAYEAAKAGIDDYAFHLRGNGNYWALCTEVAAPSAVNQQGSTVNRRPVPGNTGAAYAIELIPAEGQSSCEVSHATTTMIETSGAMKGTFRIRSTGYAENSSASITATFKTASFLDYVYFTQFETLDPITFGLTNATELENAYKQCELTRQQGRYNQAIPGTSPPQKCEEIVFRSGDTINGPLHTNDAMAICDSPVFGRNASDVIEVSAIQSGSLKGWYSGNGCTGNPTFKGTYITGAPSLVPPATNKSLETIAEPQFRFSGQVQICLNGSSMTVASISASNKDCSQGVLYSGPIPANGLVYVKNSESGVCPSTYSPFTATYPTTSYCGTAFVHGTYTGALTIATQNDIVLDESVCRGSCSSPTGNGMLGLIANNFVRIFHNYPSETLPTGENHNPNCGSSSETKVSNIVVDAAVLAINHSFIVDHYDCGTSLGTLTLHGAIAQKFRGPVGRGTPGYKKSYNYDDRLKYQEPPSFIEPEKLPWVIGRETIG